jgi:hypothetical protein
MILYMIVSGETVGDYKEEGYHNIADIKYQISSSFTTDWLAE